MATGRTLSRWTRLYLNGHDLSGDARAVGPLVHGQEIEEMEALNWQVKGGLPNQEQIGIGSINAILSANGADDIHDVFATPGQECTVMIPVGMRAEPAAGDPAFLALINQLNYNLDIGINNITIGIDTGARPVNIPLSHTKPWGVLLHAKAAKTEANAAVGIDDNGAASANGGYLMFQIFAAAGSGTVIVKVQDAATNSDGSFSDLSGATSGEIAHTDIPTAGIVQIGTTATVRRYLRWQIVLDGITSVTFALAFVRSHAHNV